MKPQIKALCDKNPLSRKLAKLRTELYDLDIEIKESINNQQKAREAIALKNIMENPRYFYSYAKQFAKQKSTVGPLLAENGDLENNPKDMANILQNQYSCL